MHGIFFQYSNNPHYLKPFHQVWQYPIEKEHRCVSLTPALSVHLLDGQTHDESYFENENFIVLIDGEISLSTSLELKKSLETLARLFEKSGYQGVISEIRAGSFNLVIFDKREQTLYFINDFIGSIPLYYAQDGSSLVISTNPRAIFKTGLINKTIDMTGVASFVHLGYGFASRHITKELEKTPANHCLQWRLKEESFSILKGDHNVFESYPQRQSYRKTNYSHLLTNACQRVAEYSGKTASFLSGGLDSRMITAAWPRSTPLEHFTYGAQGSAEINFAYMVANLNQAPIHHLVPSGDEIANKLVNIFEFSGLACFPERYYFAEMMAQQGFNSVNDGFLIDVFLGGDFFLNFLSPQSKVANYLGIFLDQSTRKYSAEAIAHAYFDSANLVKSYDGINNYLSSDFVRQIKLERENIIDDLACEVKRFSQHTESIAYIFRNVTTSNRSANYTLTQGVNARQFLKVNYPLGLDKDLIFQSLELSPNQAAYRRSQLKALQDNFYPYARIPYSRTLIPATYASFAHKWASILNGKGIYLPGFNRKYKNRTLQFNNWNQWFVANEPLRELAKSWLLSGNITDSDKVDQYFDKVAQGSQKASGHIFHLAGISRWLSES